MKRIALVLAALTLFTGCAMLQPDQTVVLSPRITELDHDSFAILPFVDERSGRKDNFGFNVSDVVTDAFETAFMKSGHKIVERSHVESILGEMKFSYMGHVDEAQLKEIGKMTNANVVILGMVRDFKKAKYERVKGKMKTTSCTTLSYSVKAVHIETGEVLWKGAITRSSGMKGDMFSPCDCNGVRFADRTSKTLVKKILSRTDAALKTKSEEYDMFPSL
ncbi:CsgG/HfaB family protein [Desulfoluna spongiiphila]|uniref:Curli production assembly/transport component CsgG n=1 Tax=Desulfoluna spongiiphila TaxID=419481 RepID=A0A1G5HLA4_9BACT|nr:CsgG/HfaB family protein [Desulfoluna spongiiphila]SCY64100.1 Curli production assembly/transport component CsgG [Desulfoluna spongiiphila]VVS93500.1 curli production assembly/transport component csgg [Desulfoluna spongiiphila]